MSEVDSGRKPGLTTDMAARMKALERQANEILRKASAYFAQRNSTPMEAMISFVDAYRVDHGVESICKGAADCPVDIPRPRCPPHQA